MDQISCFIDKNLRTIRTSLGAIVALSSLYLLCRSKHCITIDRNIQNSAIGRRLGGIYSLRNDTIYFAHVPLLHRILLGSPRKFDYDTALRVKWLDHSTGAVSPIPFPNGTIGKLYIFDVRDDFVHGLIKIRRTPYSCFLHDPAIALIKSGILEFKFMDYDAETLKHAPAKMLRAYRKHRGATKLMERIKRYF